MEFVFDEDQLLLQTTVRDFLSKECTPETIRALWQSETGRSPELWKKLAEIGLPGLLVPEAHGGLGMSELDAVLLLEEAGRAALAEPVISSAVVGARLLEEIGDTSLAGEWLPKVAAGEAVVAPGHPVSSFVSDAHVADLMLLPAGEAELHAVPRHAARVTLQPANDPSRRLATVSFEPGASTRVAEGERARSLMAAALDRGALSCAAEALGVADRMIELAVAYTTERVQFGKPIGSFQAVKHMLANAKVKLEYARPVVYRAAHSVATSAEQRAIHVSMAKLAACEAATSTAKAALQVHGAIGYTWEQDLHIWMRRAWSLAQAWGREPFHHDRVRTALLDGDIPIGPGTTF